MSTISSISSSSDVAYAFGLAQASSLNRSLYSIGNSIENGDLPGAGSKLTELMQAFPQYATSSGGTADSTNPINNGFNAVSNAIVNGDADAAKTAWSQLKTDLAGAGVKELSDGSADTAKLLADNKAAINQSVLSAIFGSKSSSQSNILGTLLGSTTTSSGSDSVSAALNKWMTYQATAGSSTTSDTSGGSLNAIV